MGRPRFWSRRRALSRRSSLGTRPLQRRLWPRPCIPPWWRRPRALLVRRLLLRRSSLRLRLHCRLALGGRSHRHLRRSRPRRLVSSLQFEARHLRPRPISRPAITRWARVFVAQPFLAVLLRPRRTVQSRSETEVGFSRQLKPFSLIVFEQAKAEMSGLAGYGITTILPPDSGRCHTLS